MSSTSDVVIVGGGINGVSIAYQLAKQGVKTSLIEKSFIAGGPTGHSSAIIRQHYSNEVTARMAHSSMQVWQNFDQIVGGDGGYTKAGFFMTVQPKDIEGLKANIKMQQSIGIDTSFVTAQEIAEVEPYLESAGMGGGAYEPDGGYCDPSMAANAFVAAAKRHGATIKIGVAATKIIVEGDRVVGLETSEGKISAGKVIIAAGPWSPKLLGHLGVEVPITTSRIKIGLFKRPDEFANHAVWADFISQIYARPETGGMMLVGSISPDEAEDMVSDPDSFNPKADLDIIAEFAQSTTERFPIMEQAQVASNYASLYDITPDWHPILDEIPRYAGLYICAGGSGHSFKLAPATGEMMASLLINGKRPDDDINLFSFDRFTTGNQVQGKYEYSIVG
ncbi:MAG: FAD-binding oxidoreductase [Chloroflexota bacterium]